LWHCGDRIAAPARQSALFLRHLEGLFERFRLVGKLAADRGKRIMGARIRCGARDLVATDREIPKLGGNSYLHHAPHADGAAAAICFRCATVAAGSKAGVTPKCEILY